MLVVAVMVLAYYEAFQTSRSSPVPGKDTFLSPCAVSGVGALELNVVHDSNGTPVQGETVGAVLRTAATCAGQAQTQVVYVTNFTQGRDGWISPVLPTHAVNAGGYDFTVEYAGKTYNFAAQVQLVSLTCVTLRVPSGNVTSSVYRYGSSCSAG